MLAVQEVTDQSDDLVQVGLERPMAGVEEVKLGGGQVAQVGARGGLRHVAACGPQAIKVGG
jgi:hypothetical protein